jgi:hypothetical protein
MVDDHLAVHHLSICCPYLTKCWPGIARKIDTKRSISASTIKGLLLQGLRLCCLALLARAVLKVGT